MNVKTPFKVCFLIQIDGLSLLYHFLKQLNRNQGDYDSSIKVTDLAHFK